MSVILVLAEHDRGELASASLEALTFARGLAQSSGADLHAALVGADARGLSEPLHDHGAVTVHIAEHDRLDEYAPAAWAASIIQLIERIGPTAVLASGTDRGAEVMAHVAARADLPLAANCTEVEPGDPWRVIRSRWGGSLLEEAALKGSTNLLTLAPNTVVAAEAPAAERAVEAFTPELSQADVVVRVVGRMAPDRDRISLGEARVVVGGGRGVGSADGFAILEELAGLVGGAVGGSRVATSLGWRSHADQIGQTGNRIAPDLYIACGISGAIQHIVGCRAAKRIMAINSDPEAPIMAQADYAVVGDLHQILPAVVEEVRKAKGA